jgi:hypothetical protein
MFKFKNRKENNSVNEFGWWRRDRRERRLTPRKRSHAATNLAFKEQENTRNASQLFQS